MRQHFRLAALGAVVALTVAVVPASAGTSPPVVYRDATQPVERRVADLLSRMSLDDKIGQMTQAERAEVTDDPDLVTRWRLGSVLSGGGSAPDPNTPQAWVALIRRLQDAALATPLKIPLLYGIDAVHGHGSVPGATVFPHNIGLGAARDAALVERVYAATAREMLATGITWDFAPCVCVTRDERWGRSYESFGEDPALVTRLGGGAVDGLQRNGVIATVKHFAADGDTENGTGDSGYAVDQGVTVTSRADFERIDLAPYAAAVSGHRVRSVMPSFSSVDWTDDGTGTAVKMHANRELITGTLKERLGFDGFVISDWEAIHQLPSGSGDEPSAEQVRAGVEAGVDMFMEPATAPLFQERLRAEVLAGRVPMSRIDDAVTRILRVKFELGLFENPYPVAGPIGTTAHRDLAREAVAASQVLLRNTGNLLPLPRDTRIYVAGRAADDIGMQSGGWTVDWQGRDGDVIPGTTILDGLRSMTSRVTYSADGSAPAAASDVGVVVVGETPYAEGFGDVGSAPWTRGTDRQREPKSLTLQPGDRAVVDRVCRAVDRCVVLIVSGRPQVITEQLGGIDALVASWLPGSEGGGVADVLFGAKPFTGRLPVSWPAAAGQVPVNVGDKTYQPLYPYGWGLRPGATDTLATAVERVAAATDARATAGERVAAGAAPEGWQSAIADAEAATESGDPDRAASLLSRLTP
ncbi:glycoside hydrolase family 3 protein [Actinoplanes philippinensis]|uniref:glycoside hydrolase family 3 protein n=1 Tax=Actinoplanes philippinensis TaxID=35752 RepID=UPI0033EC6FD3